MAFLPSLQEAAQSHTGGILLFRAERTPDRSSKIVVSSDLPMVRQDLLESGPSWGINNISGHSSLFESVAWETKTTSSTIVYEPFLSKIPSREALWKTWSGFVFTFPDFREKHLLWRGISTFITWQSPKKFWESQYKLVLDLQDLFVVGHNWDENSLLMASYLSAEVQPLEQLYDFRKPIEVSHFLEVNPFLVPLLREAYIHIRRYFPSSELFLEVVADPEAIDEEQLVVFVAVNHDPDEASEALNRLDEHWWLDSVERAQDKLCITLEFQ
jgi:hypothetical protein